jgi:hypothetical protein
MTLLISEVYNLFDIDDDDSPIWMAGHVCQQAIVEEILLKIIRLDKYCSWFCNWLQVGSGLSQSSVTILACVLNCIHGFVIQSCAKSFDCFELIKVFLEGPSFALLSAADTASAHTFLFTVCSYSCTIVWVHTDPCPQTNEHQ